MTVRLADVYGDDEHFAQLAETAQTALDQPAPPVDVADFLHDTPPCNACGAGTGEPCDRRCPDRPF